MQLSTKARYALMAMVQLAHHELYMGSSKPIKLQQLAEQQQIDNEYLQQIFVLLRRQDLVTSVKGPGGGYRLARLPQQIKVIEVMHAVERPVKITRCNAKELGGCQHLAAKCLTHEFWYGLEEHINDYLASFTLEDIVHHNHQQLAAVQ